MRRTTTIYFPAILLALFWLGGCSTDDIPTVSQAEGISVPVIIEEGNLGITRAPGDAALSVNRVLIVPFKKTSEALPNDPVNFVPDYTAAKQIDINAFPLNTAMVRMTAGSTYQIMVLGYNRSDYDWANAGNPSRRFDIGLSGRPATLADMNLKLVASTNTPEFFSCMGTGYMRYTSVGSLFKPEQINNIKGVLNRIPCGLTFTVSNIPLYVTSVSLVAEQLVTAVKIADGTPVQWQTSGDAGLKELGKSTPAAGKVTFNTFIMPTLDARKTLLYLDVSYAGFTERYTVIVPDTPNTASSSRIIFMPNHWVRITGDYSKINLGFTISNPINLDDNAWDGIHNY